MLKTTFLATVMLASAASAFGFELSSPDLPAGQPMPETFVYNGFSCTGGNQSPALTWTDPPEGTKSFAIMVHDPDAPTGGAGIWHWVAFDIPSATRSLPRGAGTPDGSKLPAGTRQVITDYDVPGWSGPCPPKGSEGHSYNFTLYALRTETLPVPASATASHAGFIINLNAIAKATLTARYGR